MNMRNKRLKEEIQSRLSSRSNKNSNSIQNKGFQSQTRREQPKPTTGHFDNDDAPDVLTSVEEAITDAISDEFHPFTNLDNVTNVEKNRAVAAAALLNNLTKGRGTKFRIDLKDDNLLLEAVHVLDILLKDKAWLKQWGNEQGSKAEKVAKLRKTLLKKWNDSGK